MDTTGVMWGQLSMGEEARVPGSAERRHYPGGIVKTCVRRVLHWPVPPNWTGSAWMKEMAAHGNAAAHEASCQYDSSRSSEPEVFVKSRVMGRLLTRYRQEWNFARRVAHWSSETEDGPVSTLMDAARADSAGDMRKTVTDAVNGLPEPDRWLVMQLFWHDRDQRELARELGVSQPAISKRYRNIVRQLRCLLVAT
jgi:DNA-directed RNA polymerase specialized sigma24 family protein